MVSKKTYKVKEKVRLSTGSGLESVAKGGKKIRRVVSGATKILAGLGMATVLSTSAYAKSVPMSDVYSSISDRSAILETVDVNGLAYNAPIISGVSYSVSAGSSKLEAGYDVATVSQGDDVSEDSKDIIVDGRTWKSHEIQKGDWLSKYAEEKGITTQDIMQVNAHNGIKIENPDLIYAGKNVYLPGSDSGEKVVSGLGSSAGNVFANNSSGGVANVNLDSGDSGLVEKVADDSQGAGDAVSVISQRPADLDDCDGIVNKVPPLKDCNVNATPNRKYDIYVVKEGETLNKIALAYNIPTNGLIKMNEGIVKHADWIYPGDKINVPKTDVGDDETGLEGVVAVVDNSTEDNGGSEGVASPNSNAQGEGTDLSLGKYNPKVHVKFTGPGADEKYDAGDVITIEAEVEDGNGSEEPTVAVYKVGSDGGRSRNPIWGGSSTIGSDYTLPDKGGKLEIASYLVVGDKTLEDSKQIHVVPKSDVPAVSADKVVSLEEVVNGTEGDENLDKSAKENSGPSNLYYKHTIRESPVLGASGLPEPSLEKYTVSIVKNFKKVEKELGDVSDLGYGGGKTMARLKSVFYGRHVDALKNWGNLFSGGRYYEPDNLKKMRESGHSANGFNTSIGAIPRILWEDVMGLITDTLDIPLGGGASKAFRVVGGIGTGVAGSMLDSGVAAYGAGSHYTIQKAEEAVLGDGNAPLTQGTNAIIGIPARAAENIMDGQAIRNGNLDDEGENKGEKETSVLEQIPELFLTGETAEAINDSFDKGDDSVSNPVGKVVNKVTGRGRGDSTPAGGLTTPISGGGR